MVNVLPCPLWTATVVVLVGLSTCNCCGRVDSVEGKKERGGRVCVCLCAILVSVCLKSTFNGKGLDMQLHWISIWIGLDIGVGWIGNE